MTSKRLTTEGAFCVLVALLILAGGCRKAGPADACARAPGDGCGAEETAACSTQAEEPHGHGHGGEPEAGFTASVDERALAPCEHAVPIYRCDECRYEAGLVKLADGIVKQGDGRGLVRTGIVERTRVSAYLPLTGEVSLNESATAHISPRIAGIIDGVAADVGMRVNAGEALLTLSSVELGRALADYERNRALAELSEKVLRRESRLREQSVGSEQDVIDAQMAFEQHRAELRASEQTLHVLGLTEEDLAALQDPPHGAGAGRLQVRAPFAGTIIDRHAVAGELAEPGSDVFVLSDLSTLWVWADVHSRDLADVLAAEACGPVAAEVAVAAFPDCRFEGTLDYIGATMNEETRTVKVRATVKNADGRLRPGMFCDVTLALGGDREDNALAVPSTAVFTDDGASFVFTHWKEGIFARRDVRTGRPFMGMVEILDGLQAGDVIASEGGFLLKSDILREKMGAGCAD